MSTCMSTHGGAGYATGSKMQPDGSIICGLCKAVIKNPPTQGSYKGKPQYGRAVEMPTNGLGGSDDE